MLLRGLQPRRGGGSAGWTLIWGSQMGSGGGNQHPRGWFCLPVVGRLLAELLLRAPELYLRGKTAETAGKRGVGSARSGIGQGPRADGGERSRKHPAAAAGTKELDPHRCLAGGELSGGVLCPRQ